MKNKQDYKKTPDMEKEPYTYDQYKKLDLLIASPLERLIMLELHSMFGIRQWFFREEKMAWDRKDMRNFVRDLAKKIKSLN